MENKYKKRKNIRLKLYDYSKPGIYFITICSKNKQHIFLKICCYNGKYFTQLTDIGNIINNNIKKIKLIYNNIELDEYVIMPNHIHIILHVLNQNTNSFQNVIKQFKRITSLQAKFCIWQKSFYEHIIRNEKEYFIIKQYIIDNPSNWSNDKYFG